MRKKYLIGLAITLTVVCIILIFLNNPRIVIYMNWKVYLQKPQERNVIYRFQYREGADLEIWQYAEKDIKKVTNKEIFKNIGEQNKEFIQQKLKEYYEVLNDTNKQLFNDNVNILSLLEESNYFAYINKENDTKIWLLLIINSKTNELYYFSNVY